LGTLQSFRTLEVDHADLPSLSTGARPATVAAAADRNSTIIAVNEIRIDSMHCLLIDDHPMMLMALKTAVEQALPCCTIANASCALQAKGHLHQDSVPIDLILLDINLPDMDGRQLLKHIRETGRTSETPVIIFTSADSDDVAVECKELGASCVVDKKSDPEHLFFSIRSALAKKDRRSTRLVDDLSAESPPTLSRRQRELADLVIAGYSNKEIAKTIGISCSTVKNHLTKMMSSMNVGSRGKLAAKLQSKTFSMADGDSPQFAEASSAQTAKR
jgi:two-component system, NarL family, nitrate/nitrite response regulator NarL